MYVSAFGIYHKIYGDAGKYLLLLNKFLEGVKSPSVNENPSTSYVDADLHSYMEYLITVISQMMVINLLLPLTEDNKLRK
jgi:hypothetical protein